ncbi:hypothetical protein FHS96_000390 [Sphingomonas zeicaulis]|uniref:hypothetical protein n=1 Tax=Sphingomonas zeicaulis TaxID=1632740 RepID=UPI003D25D074
MRDVRTFRRAAGWAVMFALASCAKPVRHVEAPPPPPPAPEAVPPRPTPPMGASATTRVPARAADGGFMTVNHGVAPEEAPWHLRAGLNVAALGCTGAQGATITAAYNAMLRARAKPLTAADAAIKARLRKERGSDWQDAHDDRMTQLYNFYALPPVQPRFCATAAAIAAREPAVDAAGFPAFAVQALAELSAPFDSFYAAYDEYRVALATWEARYGAGAPTRVAAFPPPSPRAASVVEVDLPPAIPARAASPRISYESLAVLDQFEGSEAISCGDCTRSTGRLAARQLPSRP